MKPRAPKSFKDLWVWQQGMALALATYKLTEQAAPTDKSGVVILLRRSAIAIPVSVARGHGIGRPGAFVRALLRAYGATQEIDTQLHIAVEFGIVAPGAADRVRLTNDEIGQTLLNMLTSFPLAQGFDVG
ncbi:MAG TPA: four helix bundle protein [Gemmatimonadaceae bacterium]|jgi:four helix bundle protein|nr:four helix bundle protein [Gemmatimonadaceae bacterium]